MKKLIVTLVALFAFAAFAEEAKKEEAHTATPPAETTGAAPTENKMETKMEEHTKMDKKGGAKKAKKTKKTEKKEEHHAE